MRLKIPFSDADKKKFGQGIDIVHRIIRILRNMPGDKKSLE